MSDEPFLARWSRRKREGEPREEAADAAAPAQADAAPPASDGETPAVDLTQLPPLDSIDAATDIRAFLARGVPAALSQAALRRAWAVDPAIRDFIGLAENSWDFTVPGGVPGFGPALPADPTQSLTELAHRAGSSESTVLSAPTERDSEPGQQRPEVVSPSTPDTAASPVEHANVTASHRPAAGIHSPDDSASGRIADKQNQDVASREPSNALETGTVNPRRRHGGALPG